MAAPIVFAIIESPYAPFSKNHEALAVIELARNEAYLNACMADSFARGETPFASHGIYTRRNHGVKVLDDTIPEERKKGMKAGFDVAHALHLYTVTTPANVAKFVRLFYTDRGWTEGMVDGMVDALKNSQTSERRSLDPKFWAREFDAEWSLDRNGVLFTHDRNGVLFTHEMVAPKVIKKIRGTCKTCGAWQVVSEASGFYPCAARTSYGLSCGGVIEKD